MPNSSAGRPQDKQFRTIQEELSDSLGAAPMLSQSQWQERAGADETQEGEVILKIPTPPMASSTRLQVHSPGDTTLFSQETVLTVPVAASSMIRNLMEDYEIMSNDHT